MSDLTITRTELEAGQLPLVCVVTGEPVESLTQLVSGDSKVSQIAALPIGLMTKAIQQRVSGDAFTARIGRSKSVKTKQLGLLGLRAIVAIFFLMRFMSALSSASVVGMLIAVVGGIGLAVVGGAFVQKALTVGFATDGASVTVSGAHTNWLEAYNGVEDNTEYVPSDKRSTARPVVAAGLY